MAGKAEIITNPAQLGLELGLSLATKLGESSVGDVMDHILDEVNKPPSSKSKVTLKRKICNWLVVMFRTPGLIFATRRRFLHRFYVKTRLYCFDVTAILS